LELQFYPNELLDWNYCNLLFGRLGYLIDIMLKYFFNIKNWHELFFKIDILTRYVKWIFFLKIIKASRYW
jgi:hypothetical protein